MVRIVEPSNKERYRLGMGRNIRLTRRQKEVALFYMVLGYTAEQAGRLLFIEKSTVEFHAESVRKKLGANNKVQAVRTIERYGLITQEDQLKMMREFAPHLLATA